MGTIVNRIASNTCCLDIQPPNTNPIPDHIPNLNAIPITNPVANHGPVK